MTSYIKYIYTQILTSDIKCVDIFIYYVQINKTINGKNIDSLRRVVFCFFFFFCFIFFFFSRTCKGGMFSGHDTAVIAQV